LRHKELIRFFLVPKINLHKTLHHKWCRFIFRIKSIQKVFKPALRNLNMAEKKAPKKTKTPERAQIENIEELIVDLANKGNHPAKIGLILKEKHGIHNVKALGKKISKVLKENNIEFKKDIEFVGDKIKKIEKHIVKNNQDKRSKRELVRYLGHKKALSEYYS